MQKDKLYALISVSKTGDEGICMLDLPEVGPQLAVTGDLKLLAALMKVAGSTEARIEAHNQGYKIKVAEYKRTDTRDL